MNNDRNPALCRAFVAKAKAIFSENPEIKHSWSIDADEDHCILDIPKQLEDGFDITVEVFPASIVVYAEGAHLNFDKIESIETAVQGVLGLIRDMLSPAMRVVEHRSDGKAYKWDLETYINGQWQREDTMGLFFYNYFGKKTQYIYKNRALPSRM